MGRNVGLSERKTRVFNKVLLSTNRSKRKRDDANMNQEKVSINLSVPPKPDWLYFDGNMKTQREVLPYM